MNFLKKLFSRQSTSSETSPSVAVRKKAQKQGMIHAYDSLGRQVAISRDDWLNDILQDQIQKAWNKPDELSEVIIHALNDEFFNEIEDAAIRLHEIDPKRERSTVLYAIIFLHTNRPTEAEAILQQQTLAHGEDAAVLTNLAKAQSALGREGECLRTLWRALELDPNQDNGLRWYEAIYREKDGEAAGLAAFERVAALPGSWRAQIWLARHALEQRDLESALNYYRESLSRMQKPPPTDVLMQISGDLGMQGHLLELLKLILPYYQVKVHGMSVGNNLIKALLDTGGIDGARRIIKQLQLEQRSDWKEALDFWEQQVGKAEIETDASIPPEQLDVTLLQLEHPLIYNSKASTSVLFSPKPKDSVRIAFLGSTAQSVHKVEQVTRQLSNSPGRFSRALPVYLAEYCDATTVAQAYAIIPWLLSDKGGGFAVLTTATSDDAASALARPSEGKPADIIVTTHLLTQGENWTVQMRIVRTIDAKCLKCFEYKLAEWQAHTILPQIQQDVSMTLDEEFAVSARANILPFVIDDQLDDYLFRLEQGLAVRCSTTQKHAEGFLNNPWEIIQGMLELCANNPTNVRCRLLLTCTLSSLAKEHPDSVFSFREKLDFLQTQYPLQPHEQSLIEQELNRILMV